MLNKKTLIFLMIIATLYGCMEKTKNSSESTYYNNLIINSAEVNGNILKATEYIDIDNSTVKFLFRTAKGSNVELWMGESETNLVKVQERISYYNEDGIKITNLKAGTKYFYKIRLINGSEAWDTAIYSFVKKNFAYTTKTASWAKKAIFYEIFVRSFYDGNGDGIGDFKGLKEKVGYLKSLGIDAVWLMPCFESPSYHGYDTINYYKIESDYGTNQDFIDFIKEMHKNGMKIIIDFVANHSSSDCQWFIDSASSEINKYRNYYSWADKFDDLNEGGPWGQRIWYPKNNGNYTAIFWSGMPDLNYRNYEVREEMKKAAKFWLDPNNDKDFTDGVDGFRLDAAMHIDNKDAEVTHKWWQEFNAEMKSVNPNTFIVGENWVEEPDAISSYLLDMDSTFNFYVSGILTDKAANGAKSVKIADAVAKTITAYDKVKTDYVNSTFIINHDKQRLSPYIYGGNDFAKAKQLATMLFTIPGTPFVYYGEEIGQKGDGRDDLYKREPYDWYRTKNGTGMTNWFDTKYTIDNDLVSVEEENGVSGSLLEHYKKLIQIRKENDFLYTTKPVNFNATSKSEAYIVKSNSDFSLLMVYNFDSVNLNLKSNVKTQELINTKSYNIGDTIVLGPYESVILKYTTTQENPISFLQ